MPVATNMTANAEGGGSIPAMWIPCVVFAHAFAAFFFMRMVVVMYPKAWADIQHRLCCMGKAAPAATAADAASRKRPVKPAAAAAAAGTTELAALDTTREADQDVKGTIKASPTTPAGVLSPPGAAAYYYSTEPFYNGNGQMRGPGEDMEMGFAGDLTGVSDEPGVPSQRSQVLMRRLTTMMKPMHMDWRDIGCSYNTSSGLKTVLQGVSGRADPGDMLALMGPSGAGKSTLMDILAGRKSVGNLTGSVLVDGAPRRQQAFARKTAYVPQDDNFMPTMTVFETCSYYAALTLPRKYSRAARNERILEVLTAMGLSHTMQTLVGGTLPGGIILRGLSGGERKRLSIATGIMSTPCIVFLDEPTSGLDSFAALSVMSYMRGMAQAGGQTVISSIHQPRSAIWALFDTVTLLSQGHLMYFGPRDGLVPWFSEQLGYPYNPVMHGLASDWVMDLVNIGFRKPQSLFGKMMDTPEELEAAATAFRQQRLPSALANSTFASASTSPSAESGPRLSDLESEAGFTDSLYGNGASSHYSNAAAATAVVADSKPSASAHHEAVIDEMQAKVAAEPSTSGGLCGLGGLKSSYSASWFAQFRVLLWRELLSITRNPADVAGRCLIFCWLAVFVGLIYYNLPNTLDALRARLNVLFVEPVILLLLPYVYMSLYTSDKQYYIADSVAKLYQPSAYYLAKQIAVMPFAILNILLFSFTLYGLAGLRHSLAAVGMNGLTSVLLYLIAAQVLSFAAVVTPNQDMAFMIAIAWTAINLLMSNFMVRYVDMTQQWLSQLKWISAMGFSFNGYAQAEFTGVVYSCSGGLAAGINEYITAFLPNTNGLNTPYVQNAIKNPGADCVVKTDEILKFFNLFRPFWQTCVILLGYLLVCHALTFIGLVQLARKERR